MRRIDKLGKRAAALALAVSMSMSVMPSVLAVDAEDTAPAAAQTETQPEEEEAETQPADVATADAKPVVVDPAGDQTGEVENPTVIPGPDGFESVTDVQLPTEDDGIALQKWSHSHSKTVSLKKEEATCTTAQRRHWLCYCGKDWWEENISPALGHLNSKGTVWKADSNDGWIVEEATCQAAGKRYRNCTRTNCNTYEEDKTYAAEHPQLEHSYGEWTTEPATCTKGAQKYRTCTNIVNGKVCGAVEHDEEYEKANGPLEHILAYKDEWEYPCVNGTRTYYCTREGCTETEGIPEPETLEPTAEHVSSDWILDAAPTCTTNGQRHKECTVCGTVLETDTTSDEMKALGHDWGEYIDDDKPGCQQQTETAKCQRESCNATDTKNLPNFGSDGNPLPHKYTRWDTKIKWDGIIPKEITYADCDYGCGKHEERENNASLTSNTQAAKVAADETKGMVKDTINDALRATQAKVNQAQTKEEAIAALAEFEDAAAQALVDNVKLGGTKLLTKEQAKQLLKDAIPSMDSLQDSLNDSFLSKDTIQATVNTLVNSVTSEAGSKATEDAAYELIYNAAYDKLAGGSSDNTAAVKGLVTKLVTITADGSQEDWDALTDAIVDDAVKLAIEELRKDEDYAKLLDTKLGAETLEELEALIKQQLAEDPTFMNSVRNQIKTAGANATNGVTHGWSDQKVLDGLRRDLLPVSDLVENKIKELGDGAADIADKKVDDTVHKVLPGKLGDWISGKLSNKATDAVKKKVDEANKKATTTITDYIKQLTCGSKHNRETQEVILKYPTCTEKGQKGVMCLNCGKIENKTEIPANGHTPVVDAAVEPTETSTGLTEGSHCSVCGAVLQAQETIPMLDPSIDTWFSRAATTEADAKAAGFDSVEAVNAALDAALVEAGFDPANAEHFTVQVNSSIGVLPNDRFPDDGVTGKLTLPEGTKGKMAQTYYAVQVFTANTRFHKAGDVLVTPVTVDNFSKTGLKFTVYTEAVMTIAWKAE